MKSKILFLYRTPSEKQVLELLKEATKAVLRKFRKSADFTFLKIDLSPSCQDIMQKSFENTAMQSDCILFTGNPEGCSKEELFFKRCFNFHSLQYFSSGKCVCSPMDTLTTKKEADTLTQTLCTDLSLLQKTVNLATLCALQRKKQLLICTDTANDNDSFIFQGFSDYLSMARGCETEHLSFDEMIFTISREMLSFDTILTTGSIANVLAMHINSLNKFPLSYSVYHAENIRIYKREFMPYDLVSNLSYANLLTACAGMLESELGFKNAGRHLRRSAVLTLEKCEKADINEFQQQLLLELNTPLRNRQVK